MRALRLFVNPEYRVMRDCSQHSETFGLPHMVDFWHIEHMDSVRQELDRLHASVCKGLADPKRLLIINVLRDGQMSVSEICEELDLPQSNVSQHLAILRDKGLVISKRDGQFVNYSLTSMKIIEAFDLLREVMAEQVSASASVGVRSR
jgi:DNA-binding transcriptional ArsR family regulator